MQRAVLTRPKFCTRSRDPRWWAQRRKAPRGLRVKGVFRGCFEWPQEGCGRGVFFEAASNGTADTLQVLHSVPQPSLVGAEEESPKRGASEAKGPAGPPEGAVFEELFGRAKSSPPEAKCPKGEKARAAGPGKNNAWRAKKSAGRMALKNILS